MTPPLNHGLGRGTDSALHFYNPGLRPGAGVVTVATAPLSGCLRDNLVETEMNDRWRDEIVLEAGCVFEEKERSDGRCVFPFPSLSSSVFSCSETGGSAGIGFDMRALLHLFLQGWPSYLRMCKDE